MRIKTIRISGFKPIPFYATFQEPAPKEDSYHILWNENSFDISFALDVPYLNAIIGPNSSGKSSTFYALSAFFGNKTKLPDNWYNRKDTGQPVIVEITFSGVIEPIESWHEEYCRKNPDDSRDLTVAYVWRKDGSTSKSFVLIKQLDDSYKKVGTKDKSHFSQLFPKYRLLSADKKLGDEANPERNDLISDLIDFMLEGKTSDRNWSIVYKLRQTVAKLRDLTDRSLSPNSTAWREIEELERQLSAGLESITPGNPNVRIQISDAIPDLSQIFRKGKIAIDDGIELDFSEHGMGLQRSFAVSALHAWNQVIASQSSHDYVFAIEEPELYLHPHATRVFLKTLEEIAEKNQVMFSTHSSEFVNRVPLENVISIRRQGNERKIITPNLTGLTQREKIQVRRYLQEHRSDMLFARSVLLVEGASEQYAIPAFAKELKFDLDRAGVSVVFVNGRHNFKVYHLILDAFGIPHVILGDGDGNASDRMIEYRSFGILDVYILVEDFETEVATAIADAGRCVDIINECLSQIGHMLITEMVLFGSTPPYPSSLVTNKCSQKLKSRSIGKPLAGRVIGEMLTESEIRKMPLIVKAVERTIELSQTA